LDQETPGEAATAAEAVRGDLSIVYRSTIGRINARGLKVLQWALFATRPLTLNELRFAIGIKVGMTDLNPDRDLPYASFIDLALGLLRVTVEGERHIVRFTHLSIKEYLSAHSHEYFPDGHQLLARTCLTYLGFTAMSSESDRRRYGENLHPFLEYAAFEWGHHTREATDDHPTCNMALEFLLSDCFSQLNELRCHTWPDCWLSSRQSPLHEACYFGLVPIAVKLLQLDPKFNVNGLDLVHRVPLHYAAMEGHWAIVQTLLECRNLNVNARDKWGDTPLHHASFRGHEAVVRLLLHHRDILTDMSDETGHTPLHSAIIYRHTQIVKALLCHPTIDVNRCNSWGWTALTVAIHKGSAEVVQMLLTCADIDIERAKARLRNIDHYDVTLPLDLLLRLGLLSEGLYRAAQAGDKEALLSLLHQQNLQLNSHYGLQQTTALHEAALNGHVDVVEALLQHPDIEVNSVDCFGCTALVWAAGKGQSNVVKRLLQHPKINVNQPSAIMWTALTEAVDGGRAEVVQLLLAHKDIDIGASKVAEPGFWDIKLPVYWISERKYMTLPIDLLSSLGLWTSYELTGLEIELFSSSSY
jgi:ankyrin repeat protein